jgi:hypothetical protein
MNGYNSEDEFDCFDLSDGDLASLSRIEQAMHEDHGTFDERVLRVGS